jgi:glycosyltransferase involved in cell wall biosynthesis
MTDTPRFSVTIPAYNAEATLAETLESIQAQTYRDFEVVICNDGSKDGTLALAERFAAEDPRIRVVSQENRGSGGAYNTAVRNARADLIVMISADDLLLPKHLESFDTFINENPDTAIFTCNGYYEYDDGHRELTTLQNRWAAHDECTLEDLIRACFFNIGLVYRREVFDAVGGFQEDIYAEDYIFFLRAMARGYTHRFLDVPLSVHRRSSTQKSADAIKMRRADIRALEELMDSEKLTPEQRTAARRIVRRHKANVAVRLTLATLMGAERSSKFLSRARGRRG